MNWTKFIKEIAKQKIPKDRYHKTFVGIFGDDNGVSSALAMVVNKVKVAANKPVMIEYFMA